MKRSKRVTRKRAISRKSPSVTSFASPFLPNTFESGVRVACAMLDSTLVAMQRSLRCAQQLQQTGIETFNDLSHLGAAAIEQAQYAGSLPEPMQAYRALTTGNFLDAAQNYGALVERMAGIEAGLMQQTQAVAATRSVEVLDDVASSVRSRASPGDRSVNT
jgi:hypothetical protein